MYVRLSSQQPNSWINLTLPAVTVRADARSGPAAIAGYQGRYVARAVIEQRVSHRVVKTQVEPTNSGG
jgi:hypothetical protein